MEGNNSSKKLKIALGIALALFLGIGFYTMNLYSDSKKAQNELKDEKQLVKEIIEEHMKVEIKCDELYYGDNAESRQKLAKIAQMEEAAKRVGLSLQAIAPTKSLLRLLVLVEKCVEQKEPVLLVGGKFIGITCY